MTVPARVGKQGRAPIPSRKQFNLALQRCEGYPHTLRNKALLVILFALGLRAKEAAALKLGDVYDFNENRLLDELTLLKSYTKGAKTRQIPLNNDLLTEHLGNYIAYRKTCGDRHYRKEAPLILSQKSGPFSANSLGNLAHEILCERANIHKASTYSGRRYFATTLSKNKVDVRTIQHLMGHSSLATTQNYLDTDPSLMADALKSVL